jgi:hypothetical protein
VKSNHYPERERCQSSEFRGDGFSARVLSVCAAGCITDRGRASCSHAAPVVAASATTTATSNNDRPPGMPIV